MGPTSSTARLVVIGVGNRDRGDDAVGAIVCDLLDECRPDAATTIVFEGPMLDLPMYWSATDRVIVVDAAEPAGQPGRVTEIDGLTERFTAPGTLSTHSIDVSAAIELARALDRLPAELSIVGIEGADFDFGARLTPEVRDAATTVVERVSRRLS